MCFTAQKMEFSITEFLIECNQIRSFLQISSHLLKKSTIENFSAVIKISKIKKY